MIYIISSSLVFKANNIILYIIPSIYIIILNNNYVNRVIHLCTPFFLPLPSAKCALDHHRNGRSNPKGHRQRQQIGATMNCSAEIMLSCNCWCPWPCLWRKSRRPTSCSYTQTTRTWSLARWKQYQRYGPDCSKVARHSRSSSSPPLYAAPRDHRC